METVGLDNGRKTLLGCLSVPFIFAVGIAATIWQAKQRDPNIQQIEIARNVAMCGLWPDVRSWKGISIVSGRAQTHFVWAIQEG